MTATGSDGCLGGVLQDTQDTRHTPWVVLPKRSRTVPDQLPLPLGLLGAIVQGVGERVEVLPRLSPAPATIRTSAFTPGGAHPLSRIRVRTEVSGHEPPGSG